MSSQSLPSLVPSVTTPPSADLLEVHDLVVTAGSKSAQRPILRGVDLRLAPGEALALVGESGSGKSMLARSVMHLLAPGLTMSGSIRYRGRELVGLREQELQRLRGREIAMVFQDPFTALNPTMTCGDQVVELLRDGEGRPLRGESRREEIARRLAEVGVTDAAVGAAYPGELSGGLRQRVGIAASLALDPAVVIADEPTTALDVTTQREILRLLRSLQRSRGMGLILITHDLRVAFSMCDRAAVMYAGAVVETGPSSELSGRPGHPYTSGLLGSEPPTDRRLHRISGIGGSSARAADHPHDCAFAPRCAWAVDICRAERPPLLPVGPARSVACHRHGDHELTGPAGPAREDVAAAGGRSESPLPPILTIRGISKTYGSIRRQVTALAEVDLEIGAGEAVGIVGESGSGKTTLARCLMGLERPDAGTITLAGTQIHDYGRLGREDLARVRRTVQMVFQDPNSTLNPAKTVGATVLEAARTGGKIPSRDSVAQLLERVGLSASLAGRKPRALSGGQRQRVAIARALAVEPSLLVCDEAVSALDVSVQSQVLNLLNDLREELGISILFITHDLAVVRQVVDRVYVMHRGRAVESGPTANVLDTPRDPYTRTLMAAAPRRDSDWLEVAPDPPKEHP